jgi:polysaccharide biosynthesis transport protein
VVIEGLQVDIGLSNNRFDILNGQIADMQARLNRLAEFRAEYSSRVASAENSHLILNQARKQLSEVRAKQAAAQEAHLITAIDSPETGPYPVGLGRTMVVVLGTFGGLVMGLAWLFLNVPTERAVPGQPERIVAAPVRPSPWSTPASSNQAEPAFDFSTYAKKPREALPVAAAKGEIKPGATKPVIVGTSLSTPSTPTTPSSLTS